MEHSNNTQRHKSHLRSQLRSARQQIEPEDKIALDARICAAIVDACAGIESAVIAAYLALPEEPDIESAMIALRNQGHTICVPVIHPTEPAMMAFHEWRSDAVLKNNRYGIREPCNGRPVLIENIDQVFMPLLGYTLAGQRLGMGGGYYDSCFTSALHSDAPTLCGVAYSLQELEHLETDPWDVPMNTVFTEHGLFTFPR